MRTICRRRTTTTNDGDVEEKPRSSKSASQRRRGFVNAPLTTVLRFIHSSASAPHRSLPPPRLARGAEGGCHLNTHTYTLCTRVQHTSCDIYTNTPWIKRVFIRWILSARDSKPTRLLSRFLFTLSSLSLRLFLSFVGRRDVRGVPGLKVQIPRDHSTTR